MGSDIRTRPIWIAVMGVAGTCGGLLISLAPDLSLGEALPGALAFGLTLGILSFLLNRRLRGK